MLRKTLFSVVALSLLAGCGTHLGPVAQPLSAATLAARGDANKHAIAPPAPLPPRQGFNANDAASIATQAYATAFATKDVKGCHQVAALALEKIAALLPDSALANEVVPYAQAMLKTDVADNENARRLALWPLLYISKGVKSATDPVFFELTAKMMQSMLNFKDGMAVGMTTLNFLSDSSNGYVKTMVAKAMNAFKDPKTDMQTSFKNTLATLEDIGSTLKVTGHR